MIFLSALLSISLLPASVPAASALEGEPPAQIDARLTSMEGEVTVYYHDQKGGIPAQEGMPLEAGDRVKTGSDSRAELCLDGESVIDLGPDGEFTVAGTRPGDSSFILSLGSLVAKIKSLVSSGGRMRIGTPTAVASVRGTEFAVEALVDGTSHVGVFDEGKISVADAAGKGETTLEPNQETSVKRGQAPAPARKLDRFERLQDRVARARQRLGVLKKRWKAMAPEERVRKRKQVFEQRRDLQQRLQEKRRENKRIRQERPRKQPAKH